MPPMVRTRLSEAAAFIDSYVIEQQRILNVPGISVCLRLGDEIVLSKGYGWANIAAKLPLRPDHIFRIASYSKVFTSTAIMMLFQQEKLRLDDRIGTYVDGIPESIAGATIRQTLNHAAGVIRDGLDSNYWQLHRPFPDTTGLMALTKDILQPNESFKYSNIGYSLLGRVIETVSGTPYNQFVREYIVDRLGLTSTGPDTEGGPPANLVTGYTGPGYPFERLPIPDVPTHAMASATGFYSTAEELSRFAAAHFMGNEELLTDASKREMQRGWWDVDQSEDRYGLGLGVAKIGDRKVVGHSGGFPGHATRTWFDPIDRLAVVVLTNETGDPATLLARSIYEIINLALKQDGPTNPGSAIDLTRFGGKFADLWGVMNIVAFGRKLYALTPAADNPATSVAELEVVDAETLKIAKTSGFGSPGELVLYERDGAGTITQITFGGGTMYPLETLRERLKDGVAVPVSAATVISGTA